MKLGCYPHISVATIHEEVCASIRCTHLFILFYSVLLMHIMRLRLPFFVNWLCARGVAQWLGTSALRSVNASAAKELSSMGQVGGDLESNMSVRTLDSLTVSIDTTAVLYVSLGLLAVMLVCVAISCIPMLRKSPRSLSELR